MIIPAYLGEAVHHLKNGRVCRFRPEGPYYFGEGEYHENPIEDYGEGGVRAARLIIGLNVGRKPKWTPKQVMEKVYKWRKAKGLPGSMTVIAQLGIYEDTKNRKISERSVQVILLDLGGDEKFVENVLKMAEEFCTSLKQEQIIVEIQKSGVVERVYSATHPGKIKE